jgi:hypothetical protein
MRATIKERGSVRRPRKPKGGPYHDKCYLRQKTGQPGRGRSGTRPGAGVPRPTIVTEELALSAIEYDSFLSSPLGRRSWLKGRGGWDKNGVRRAIALKCPGRITLYVDPSGYDYGRYVGVKV